MEDYNRVNRDVYNRYAGEFEKKTKNYLKDHILKDAELFISKLKGKKVLDLGSGPGRDSLFFKERGLDPVCVDISSEMIKLCKEKGLNAYEMDIEDMDLDNKSFDGVWAYTSLLHMPKAKMAVVLAKISNILKDDGIFYLGMKEGNFEGWLSSEKYGGIKRFFSLYLDEELRNLLLRCFNVAHFFRVKLGDAVFLNYLCRKKSS